MQTQKNVQSNIQSSSNVFNLRLLSSQRSAHFFLLFSNFIWGITPIFVEVVLEYLTPLQTTTLRFGVAVLVLSLVILFIKGRNGFSMLSEKTIILLGWFDALGYLAATIGQDITTPGIATLLASFYVFIVPFIAWKLEGTKLNWRIVVIGVISLLGIFLICFDGNWANFTGSSIHGTFILMFSAVMWGFYTVITGKFLNIASTEGKKVDLMSFTYASLFHTFLALVTVSLVFGDISLTSLEGIFLPKLLEVILFLVFLGIFPTIIALGLWNWAITRLGSIKTSFYQLLQVIIPFILEFAFLQQFYSGWIYTGILLILISTLWINKNADHSIE
ncbi:MAG: DMT family transporter [Promethearchaeota archaeon]